MDRFHWISGSADRAGDLLHGYHRASARLAIASNVLFIVYGIAGHLYPVLLLHAVLLPVNFVKIMQLRLKVRRVKAPRG